MSYCRDEKLTSQCNRVTDTRKIRRSARREKGRKEGRFLVGGPILSISLIDAPIAQLVQFIVSPLCTLSDRVTLVSDPGSSSAVFLDLLLFFLVSAFQKSDYGAIKSILVPLCVQRLLTSGSMTTNQSRRVTTKREPCRF